MKKSKEKPDNINIDADDVSDEDFEIVDINGERGILTLSFDDLVKEQNKDISEEELQKIADKLILSMFGDDSGKPN
jgi:methyltransferase-like protein